MAKLCRFVKLHDRFNAQVFTFMVPSKILREFSPDIYSKDFLYGQQKWNVSFVRSDKHIGVFLKLTTPSQGLRCRLDFAFSIVNKEHFTKTTSFIEKTCEFTPECQVFGRKTFAETEDLTTSFIEKTCEFTPECQVFGRKTFAETEDLVQRNFVQDTGELMLELEMRNIHNLYECFMRLPKDVHANNHHNSHNHHGRHGYHSERLESTYFLYGLSDWSVSLFPDASSTEADGSVAVQLQRHSSFDHLCCVRYRVILGDEGTFDSGDLEQVLDASGVGEPFTVGASVSRLARGRSTLRVKVEMISVVYVSEASVSTTSSKMNRAHLYDRDKQAWMLEVDTSGKHVAFRLFYSDISHVPRKLTRYVAWHLRILTRGNSKTARPLNGPYSKYYVQQEVDEGFVMKTDIPVAEVTDPDSVYVDPEDRKLSVYIEWQESHLLIAPNYNSQDDVTRLHKHQMSRELLALQAENYALEKQLYSYQQSIAKKDARGSRGDSLDSYLHK